MRVHFIAIGGSAMHNLAIAMCKKGYTVTGSDDEIFEPARSRLASYHLLPEAEGWFPEKLNPQFDAVILGMHARADNPELLRAQELGLKIFSYPEFLYEQSKNKKRIVIGGSHGKTTITAMILHVLNYHHVDTDYMVGAQLEGFDVMVKLSEDANYMVIEGDEYLTSPIDRRPKFHVYKPDIALISGIAWDHKNVFPTFDNYVEQFRIFTNLISPGGTLIYCADDQEVKRVAENCKNNIKKIPYLLPDYTVKDGITYINYVPSTRERITNYELRITNHEQLSTINHQPSTIPLQIFGRHNLLNLNGARLVCNELGITDEMFFQAISSFKGASKRLELIAKDRNTAIFKDFAHSPSKLKATTRAVKEQFTDKTLVACMELHTFSSLSSDFLPQYDGAMNDADVAIVYFSPHALALKKLPPLTVEQVKQAFNRKDLQIFTDSSALKNYLLAMDWTNKNLLMMSSGNFDGLDLAELSREIIPG
jgi:UDP-N-acetylmuramate: L-alanyl-gamma-D-glutamyl-meso-diaminopimelate ligase